VNINGNLNIGINTTFDIYDDGSAKAGTVNLKGNFTNDGTFDAINGGKVTMNGTSAQTIGGTTTATFYDLVINNSSDVTLNKADSVSNSLALTSGDIKTTSTNILTLLSAATVSGGSNSSHVDGPMQKVSTASTLFQFPTGEEGFYKPVGVTPSTANKHLFKAQAWNDSPTEGGYSENSITSGEMNNVSSLEYWDVDRITTGTYNSDAATVRLYWGDSSEVDAVTSDLVVAHWNGTKWDSLGQTAIDGTNKWVEVSGVNSFSPFTLGSKSSGNNPLPVELLYFKAEPKGTQVKLSWETASELNNDYFTVEHSRDAVNFEPVITISGSGYSNNNIEYNTFDESPFTGTSYYRLKQTDYDGQFEYSDIEPVQFELSDQFKLIGICPNPVSDHANIRISSTKSDKIKILLYDSKGDRVFKQTFNVIEGMNKINLDLLTLNAGYYYLALEHDNGVQNSKLFKASTVQF